MQPIGFSTMAEILVGSEWIVVDETPASLRDAMTDVHGLDSSDAPMANWVAFTLPNGVMRVAVSAINGIRWGDDEDT
jgi:hypothetical protein